ncbi:MAG: dCMP deaminase family protein [Candidatus Brocadiales bacterium]|nr:dCMP deaminase family protein [Candidatus Brocadiales bacterium]
MNRPDWDQYFMTIAYLAASRSTDQSTHVGAVIVTQDNAIVSTGYNGPVRGEVYDTPQERPEKYLYIEHAERNAIYNAARHGTKLDQCKLYVNFLPCADCARAIVQSGITEVIAHTEGQQAFNSAAGGGDWDDSHKATMRILGGEYNTWHNERGILRWFSGELWMPKGYFKQKEFDL